MFDYFKPRFSSHPLNYIAVLLVFIGSFGWASYAVSDDFIDQYYTEGFYYTGNGYTGHSPSEIAALYNASVGGGLYFTYENNFGTNIIIRSYWSVNNNYNGLFSATRHECGSDGSNYCVPFPPPEPQNCSELATENPDSHPFNLPGGYSLAVCKNGCRMTQSGSGIHHTDGSYSGGYKYSGLPCPSGFSMGEPMTAEKTDVYNLDDELQNCYTPDGVLLGRVGIGMSCPTGVYACYDSNGTFTGTAPGGSECESGSKNFSSERPVSDVSSTQKKCLADGTCTETTETVNTEKAPDGSIVSSTTRTTKNYDADGNLVSEETETEESACLGEECNAVEVSVTGADDCAAPPICTGDVIQCNSLLLQWYDVCSASGLTADALTAFVEAPTSPQSGTLIDEWGQLSALDGGQVDVDGLFDFNSTFGDNGRAGSCPADESTVLGAVFKWDTICDASSEMRPLVLFAAVFLCIVMIRRTVLEGG
jgi:hypothetical protein